MRFLRAVSDPLMHTDSEGRRIFFYGTIFTRKRCVFVTEVEEQALRRVYEWAFAVLIMGVSFMAGPSWIARAAFLLPLWFLFITITFRRKTAGLSPAPAPFRRSQRDIALSGAQALGKPLLWFELLFFLFLGAISSSPLIDVEVLGWQKYACIVLGFGGVGYVSYQLHLLRRSAA